jgi:hypothetical protein
MPTALISWGDGGKFHYHTVYGSQLFKIREDAISNALALAIKWIDFDRGRPSTMEQKYEGFL